MRIRSFAWLTALLCASTACRAVPRLDATSEEPTLSATNAPPASARKTARLRYVHRVLGGASANDELPWVVAFHGLGDTPENFARLFEDLPLRVHVYFPQAPLPRGSGYDWFGARVNDQDGLTLGVRTALPLASELLELLAEQPYNLGDAVVTGFSQGGIMSFALAAQAPAHVKIVLPIAGYLPPALVVAPKVPVVAFHGEADLIVPFAQTFALIEDWRASSPDLVQLHSYPGIQHNVGGALYEGWARVLQAAIEGKKQ